MSRQLQAFATHTNTTQRFRQCSNEIKKIITQAQEKRLRMQNRAIGIVAVFGPDDPPNKTLFTDWLIHYYEYSSRVENKGESIESENHLEFLDGWQDLEEDIYFWPELYNAGNQHGAEPLVCLILYIKGDSRELYEMAAAVCSQAFLLKTENQDETIRVIETIYPNKAGECLNLIELPEKFNQRDLIKSDEFLEYLDEHPLTYKTDGDGNIVRLSNFDIFIDQTALRLSGQNCSTYSSINTHGIVSSDTNPLEGTQTKMKSIQTDLNRVGEQTSMDFKQPHGLKKTLEKRCRRPSCDAFYKTLISNTQTWLENQDRPWTLPNIHILLQTFKDMDDHENFSELEESFNLVDTFASDLRNMFDNYVCFYGEDDKEQFRKLVTNVWHRASAEFHSKKFPHSTHLWKIFESACCKIEKLYIADNTKIVKAELHLAEEIKIITLKEFRSKLIEHLESINPTISFAEFVDDLKKIFVLIMAHCMDHNGRLNHVQTKASREILNDMNVELQNARVFVKENHLMNDNQVVYAVYCYQKETFAKNMYNMPSNFTEEEIYKHHNDTLNKYVDKIMSLEDKQDACRILHAHFIHILSKRWEQIQSLNVQKTMTTAKTGVHVPFQTNTICIYLVPHMIHLDYMSASGHQHILFTDNHFPWAPGLVALNINGNFVYGFDADKIISRNHDKILHNGRIDSYIRNMTPNDTHSRKMLSGLFSGLKSTSNQVYQKDFKNCVVAVASWYTEEHFRRVRLAAEDAGFFEVFVVKESSVISFNILESTRSRKNGRFDLAVSVSVAPSGVLVEIFGNYGEDEKIVLLGVAFSGWNSKSDGGYHNGNQIHWAYTKAFSQIAVNRQIGTKYCFLLGELPDSQTLFHEYFKKQKKVAIVADPREIYGTSGSAKLSVDPCAIRDRIIDYTCVDILTTSWRDLSCNKNDPGCCKIAEQKDRISVEKVLSDEERFQIKREQLFGLCESIRNQMKSGEVKVMRSFLKNINERLHKAEEVASNKYSSSFEVERQESEIDELLTEYGFKGKQM